MSELRSKGPRLRADGAGTNPAQRLGDDRAAAPSPDEAIQRDEVRRFFNLLIAAALMSMLVDGIASIAISSPRWFAPVIVGGLFGAWLVAGPRRAVDHENVEAIVSRVAIVLVVWILAVTLLRPFLALALVPGYLVPIAFALPHLEGRKLRLIMGLAWAAAVGSMLVHLLPDDSSAPAAVETLVESVVTTVVIGVVVIVLYRSAEGLKAWVASSAGSSSCRPTSPRRPIRGCSASSSRGTSPRRPGSTTASSTRSRRTPGGSPRSDRIPSSVRSRRPPSRSRSGRRSNASPAIGSRS